MKQHSLRRQDRSLHPEAAWQLLTEAIVGRLAMVDKGYPYVIPLHHIVINETIYFHSATTGRKLDVLGCNPQVCYEVDRLLGIRPGETACQYGSYYESVLAFGTAFIVECPHEKAEILYQLTKKIAAPTANFPSLTSDEVAAVAVIGIHVNAISGKSLPLGPRSETPLQRE